MRHAMAPGIGVAMRGADENGAPAPFSIRFGEGDIVGELALAPVVDDRDVAAVGAGQERVVALDLLVDPLVFDGRREDVDDLVVPQSHLSLWT